LREIIGHDPHGQITRPTGIPRDNDFDWFARVSFLSPRKGAAAKPEEKIGSQYGDEDFLRYRSHHTYLHIVLGTVYEILTRFYLRRNEEK
jgi:hypothetical protein